MNNTVKRIISISLIFSIMLSFPGCFGGHTPLRKDDNLAENYLTENVITELVYNEDVVSEFITQEVYLKEVVIAEDKITELLLEEESINDVLSCQTIYVPQDSIDEFSQHSQADKLFGESIDLKPVLTKIAIGTGVIITLVTLKVANLPQTVSSLIVSAAKGSITDSASGAAIGSLFGGLTGAADAIDDSGRISAVVGFATAAVGLIMATISAIGAIPSAGSSSVTLAAGVHLALAGVKVATALGGTVYAGENVIKSFEYADSKKIDWENINWKKVGESAVKKSIKNGADGYMWGAIYGAVDKAAESYYKKYSAPYTKYKDRLAKTPKNGENGRWSGTRGESDFILDKPIKLPDGTEITKVTYKNAVPDFSPYEIAEVKVPQMTNERYNRAGNIPSNFEQADTALAEYWTQIKFNGKSWTSADVKAFRENYPYKLTWHEMSNMETMQLVPYEVNDTFGHYGGVAEYNAMIRAEGVSDYD